MLLLFSLAVSLCHLFLFATSTLIMLLLSSTIDEHEDPVAPSRECHPFAHYYSAIHTSKLSLLPSKVTIYLAVDTV